MRRKLNLKRTEVLVDMKTYEALLKEAEERGSSLAETVRRILYDALRSRKSRDEEPSCANQPTEKENVDSTT